MDEAFNQKTYNQNRAMGQALLSSRLRLGGRVVTSFLTLEEMHALEVLPKHMEGIVEQMRNTKDVELAVFLYENEDHTFKVSFRVNGAFDAASLAMPFWRRRTCQGCRMYRGRTGRRGNRAYSCRG